MAVGALALLVFFADLFGFDHVLGSPSSDSTKALWILAIVALPVLGFLAWLVAGPKLVEEV